VGLWWTWNVLVGLFVVFGAINVAHPEVPYPRWEPSQKPEGKLQEEMGLKEGENRERDRQYQIEMDRFRMENDTRARHSNWMMLFTALLLIGYVIGNDIIYKRRWIWYFFAGLCLITGIFGLSLFLQLRSPYSERLLWLALLAPLPFLGYVLHWYFHNRMKSFAERVHSAFAKGDYDLAIHLLDGAVPFWTTELNKVHLLCGIARDKRGLDGGPDFDRAVALNRNYAEAHFHRANHYYTQGRYAQAITEYLATLRLDPKHARANYNRASAYFDSGNPEQGRLSLAEARRLAPYVEQAADIIHPRQSQVR
jgi:tetratricopeptide (TPR) repeat protein